MQVVLEFIARSRAIIQSAMQQMDDPIDPADRHLYNLAPEGWEPLSGDQIIQQRLQNMYGPDLEEMTDLAVKAYMGVLTAQEAARLNELTERYEGEIGGIKLLLNGDYNSHFLEQGLNLDLGLVEANANAFNDKDNHIVIQSIFDPVVANKKLTIDEYSVVVNLPDGFDPSVFLLEMAGDMDGTLGSDFHKAGDFQNQGTNPEIGQIIDIDVKDVPQWWASIPFIDDESPVNAPVLITQMTDNHFTVQTLELNGNEHPLHGTRQWGFEELEDGTVRFYTRGISVEDTQLAEWGAKAGERNMWNTWVDGVQNIVEDQGGSILPDSRVSNQSTGPTGNDLWNSLTPSQQGQIQQAQIGGLEREIERLEAQIQSSNNPSEIISVASRIDHLNGELESWINR